MAHEFVREYLIKSRLDIVWKSLTDSKELSAWQRQKCVFGKKQGEEYTLFDGWVHGTILEITPKTKLSYTWKPIGWNKKWKESIVILTLINTNEGIKIIVQHNTFPNKKEKDSHYIGWSQEFFKPLKKYLEKK